MSARAFPANRLEQPESEQLAWERYRVAALIHDDARTVRTWQARQAAYHAWTAAFLHNEGIAA